MKSNYTVHFRTRAIIGFLLVFLGITIAIMIPKNNSWDSGALRLARSVAFLVGMSGLPFLISFFQRKMFAEMKFYMLILLAMTCILLVNIR